jgi:catechol 2,3-dioxygenase-like lactoylglutathione lyase family enzyme
MFLGLRTVIYPAPDLAASKAWFTALLGIEPYFDQPFYVGFDVGGYELGLDPNADPATGAQSYWGVSDVDTARKALLDAGARPNTDVLEPGDGIRVASVLEPGGSFVGIIENPHFRLPAAPSAGPGPGR